MRNKVQTRVNGAIQTFTDSKQQLVDEENRLQGIKDTVDEELCETADMQKHVTSLVKALTK